MTFDDIDDREDKTTKDGCANNDNKIPKSISSEMIKGKLHLSHEASGSGDEDSLAMVEVAHAGLDLKERKIKTFDLTLKKSLHREIVEVAQAGVGRLIVPILQF